MKNFAASLKSYGIGDRAHLFEVVQKVGEVNFQRQRLALGFHLTGKYDVAIQETARLANEGLNHSQGYFALAIELHKLL